MKFNLTLERLLKECQDLPFLQMPFSREIILLLPDEIDYPTNITCKGMLELIRAKDKRILKWKLEDILSEDENKKIRWLVRLAFVCGILGSFASLGVVLFIAYMTQEPPDFWLVFVLVGIPAGIMWTHSGVLKAENAKSLGKFLGEITTARFGLGQRRAIDYDVEDDRPSRKHKSAKRYGEEEDAPSYPRYDENNNGNPFDRK